MAEGADSVCALLYRMCSELVAGGSGVCRVELGDLNLFCESEFGEQPDTVIVDVELIPGEAVARADRMGMMVIVPAFAAGEDGDPPVVAGIIAGLKAALAPKMRCRVDEPGGMQTEGNAKEGSPEDHADASGKAMTGSGEHCAEDELEEASDGEWEPVVLRQPDVDRIAGKIGSVTAEERGFGVQGAAGENPAGVGPPGAIMRCVRVALVVRVLVMDAMRSHPEDRATLKGHRPAGGDEIFDPLGSSVAAMGKEAMIGHADAYVDREEIHNSGYGEVCPGKEEESSDSPNVEERHGDGGYPVDAAFLVLAAHAKIFADLLLGCGCCGDGRPGG